MRLTLDFLLGWPRATLSCRVAIVVAGVFVARYARERYPTGFT